MCLKIGDVDYCAVLDSAPQYRGISLELWQHDIEENHTQVTPELEELISQACGLSLSAYRERCAEVRGSNAVKQLKNTQPEDIGRWGGYFTFPASCRRWVRGEVHIYPQVPLISPNAAAEVWTLLSDLRYWYFRNRMSLRDKQANFWQYPERISWMLRLRADLKDKCHFDAYLRKIYNKTRLALNVTPDIRLTLAEIETLVNVRTADFLSALWQPDHDIVLSLMAPEELAQLHAFAARRGNMMRVRKKTRSVKRRWRLFEEDFAAWGKLMRPKYEAQFRQSLRDHLMNSNLAPEPSSIAIAA
jgi:hypothetical protein